MNNVCFCVIIGNCDRPDYQEAINKHLKDPFLIQQLSLLKQRIRGDEKKEEQDVGMTEKEGDEGLKEEGGGEEEVREREEEGRKREEESRRRAEESRREEEVRRREEEGRGREEEGRRREEGGIKEELGEISPVYVPLSENLIKILVEMIELPTSLSLSLSKRQVSSLKMSRFIYSLNVIYSEKLVAISKP